jgi:hypothetical protein
LRQAARDSVHCLNGEWEEMEGAEGNGLKRRERRERE